MKKFLITLLVVSLLALAGTASAEWMGPVKVVRVQLNESGIWKVEFSDGSRKVQWEPDLNTMFFPLLAEQARATQADVWVNVFDGFVADISIGGPGN